MITLGHISYTLCHVFCIWQMPIAEAKSKRSGQEYNDASLVKSLCFQKHAARDFLQWNVTTEFNGLWSIFLLFESR